MFLSKVCQKTKEIPCFCWRSLVTIKRILILPEHFHLGQQGTRWQLISISSSQNSFALHNKPQAAGPQFPWMKKGVVAVVVVDFVVIVVVLHWPVPWIIFPFPLLTLTSNLNEQSFPVISKPLTVSDFFGLQETLLLLVLTWEVVKERTNLQFNFTLPDTITSLRLIVP